MTKFKRTYDSYIEQWDERDCEDGRPMILVEVARRYPERLAEFVSEFGPMSEECVRYAERFHGLRIPDYIAPEPVEEVPKYVEREKVVARTPTPSPSASALRLPARVNAAEKSWWQKVWNYVTKDKCPACHQSSGEPTHEEVIGRSDRRQEVEREDYHTDAKGNFAGKTYRGVIGTVRTVTYNQHYRCSDCAHCWYLRMERSFEVA